MVKVKIEIVQNGAVLTVNHPDNGSDAGFVEQRVFRSMAELVTRLGELWGQYAPQADDYLVRLDND